MNTPAKGFILMTALLLQGCGTTIYSVKIPLAENPESPVAEAANVTIDDRRPEAERTTHTGKRIFDCERWYGDDTFQPDKLVALRQLIAQRIPATTTAVLRLDRFDTIEFCENSANRAGAAAAYGASSASGNPIYTTATSVPGGDSLHLRLAGEINGAPFSVTRAFDYDGLPVKFGEMPSANARYRALLWSAMGGIADEIVSKIPAKTGS